MMPVDCTIDLADCCRACGADGIRLYTLNKDGGVACIANNPGIMDFV